MIMAVNLIRRSCWPPSTVGQHTGSRGATGDNRPRKRKPARGCACRPHPRMRYSAAADIGGGGGIAITAWGVGSLILPGRIDADGP